MAALDGGAPLKLRGGIERVNSFLFSMRIAL